MEKGNNNYTLDAMRCWFRDYVRNRPALFTILYQTRLLFSPALWISRLTRLKSMWGHKKKTVVIARPGDHGFMGGTYNPGAVANSDKSIILLAKAQVCHWWDAIGINSDKYYKGKPIVFNVDRKFRVQGSKAVVNMRGFPDAEKYGLEDFRLFRVGETIWVNHSVIGLARRHPCVVGFDTARPGLSQLELKTHSLVFQGFPSLDFSQQSMEKNWVYFEHQEELYLIYSFNPYRVLKLTDPKKLEFRTVVNQATSAKFADFGGYSTMVSLGTNPVEYDQRHWLMFVHQVERKYSQRLYHHWAVLLDKSNLKPSKISRNAIFSGCGARGRMYGIYYLSSVVAHGTDFLCFAGEGDAYVTGRKLLRVDLDSRWKPIGQQSNLRDQLDTD